MASLRVTVDSSRFKARASAYESRLRRDLTAKWEEIVRACLDNILERTPDPITEYRFIQGYEGGIFFQGVGRRKGSGRGHNSAKPGAKHRKLQKFGSRRYQAYALEGDVGIGSDRSKKGLAGGGSNRISFIRAPGMWLQDLVEHPSTRVVEDGQNGRFFIGLGVVPALEMGSRFSWQNYGRVIHSISHTSEYGMWSFFEEGKSGTQQARFGNADYKLKPYNAPEQWYWQTKKFYPRKLMYGGFNPAVFKDAVRAIIAQVAF